MPNAQILVPKFYCAIKKNRVYGEVVDSLAAAKNRPDERGGFVVQKNNGALQGRLGRGAGCRSHPEGMPEAHAAAEEVVHALQLLGEKHCLCSGHSDQTAHPAAGDGGQRPVREEPTPAEWL